MLGFFDKPCAKCAFGPRFMHRVVVWVLARCVEKDRAKLKKHGYRSRDRCKVELFCGLSLHSDFRMPRGNAGARSVVGRLYNASGSCIWWLGVCGHCVVVLAFMSVLVCLLVVSWMSVENAGVSCWLFFLFLHVDFDIAVHDSALAAFWGWGLILVVGCRSVLHIFRIFTTRSNVALDR